MGKVYTHFQTKLTKEIGDVCTQAGKIKRCKNPSLAHTHMAYMRDYPARMNFNINGGKHVFVLFRARFPRS